MGPGPVKRSSSGAAREEPFEELSESSSRVREALAVEAGDFARFQSQARTAIANGKSRAR